MAKKTKEGSQELELDLKNDDAAAVTGDPVRDAIQKTQESGDAEGEKQETPEDVIQKLKKQLQEKEKEARDERDRAVKAEKEHVETQKRVSGTENDLITARENAVDAALVSADVEITALEEQYTRFLEEGNAKSAVEVNRKLAQANYKKLRLDEHKEELKFHKERAKQAAEAAKNAPQLSPEQKQWIKDHPKYENDPDYRADTVAAHYAAMGRGLSQGSGAYLKFIDSYLERLHGDEEEEGETQTQEEKPKKTNARSVTSFAAPSGRSTPSTTSEKRQAELSASEKALCKEMGWAEDTYKKNKVKAAERIKAK